MFDTVITEHDDGTVTIVVSGVLDLRNSDRLGEELDRCFRLGKTRIRIDLSGVTFMDSSGMGLLLKSARRLRAVDGDLILVAPSTPVTRVLDMTHLSALFRIARDPKSEGLDKVDGI